MKELTINQVICPCCNGHFPSFLPYGVIPRPNTKCPTCSSKGRHRLLWLYLKNRTNFFADKLKVLHFAPEKCFEKVFVSLPNLDYVTTDLTRKATINMDITDIPLDDHSFDVILCSHVLEHILDDGKAMRELFRILKPGGWAIIQSPLDTNREQTYEDPTIVLPEERERAFGLEDHVRIYGRDYKDRLAQAGFTVTVDSYGKDLGSDVLQKYGLKPKDIYFCTKPISNNSKLI